MKSQVLRFVANDTKPQVLLVLTREDGTPQDLTEATVTLRLRERGGTNTSDLVLRKAFINPADASQGRATVVWEDGDLDLRAGRYEAEVAVEYSTGGRETVFDTFRIQVRENFQ